MRIPVVCVALAACAPVNPPVTASVAAAHGSADLRCPYEQTSAYQSARGTWIAKGCGAWAEYSCTRPYTNIGPTGSAMCNRIAVHEVTSR